MADAVLLVVLVLATSVWIGGLVTIAVVARVAARTLEPAQRIALFRGLGRTYGVLGGLALVVALVVGAVLVAGRPWDPLLTTSATVAASLLAVTTVGVAQARRMTRGRTRALAAPANERVDGAVRRGARQAATLRMMIGALSLTLVVLGALLAT